jgi:hypothetical protein
MKNAVKFFLILSVVFIALGFVSCKSTETQESQAPTDSNTSSQTTTTTTSSTPAPAPASSGYQSGKHGIYVGIVSFGPDANVLTGSPVYLDEDGRDELLSVIDNDYNRAEVPGTALYYAVHKAIAEMTDHSDLYPDTILGAATLTFTDGLDTSSTFIKLPAIEGKRFASDMSYQSYINNEIETRIINNANLYGGAVGVKSYDVVDPELFELSLESIATEDCAVVLDDFYGLSDTFEYYADQIDITLSRMTGKVSLTGFPVGTTVRFTFDVPLKADGSAPDAGKADTARTWMEGTLALNDSGDGYVLDNIKYSGIVSSSGTKVPGVINGSVIDFEFENVEFFGYGSPVQIQQWYKGLDTNLDWQFNTEYLADQSTSFETIERTGVVYLVLDCSTSLSDDDILAIKGASKDFIRALYEKAKK